jgi:dihydrofolate synthase/folylpolyglutamate synthase
MTPHQARRWIAEREILGMRFGLERMSALLGRLGHPERAAPALHIVGTNGKSSTARLASAALASQGLRVGTYLSPHVTDWTERIQIAGAPIGEEHFARATAAVRDAAAALGLPDGDVVTQFEALTAIAFWAFREARVDAEVIEAGLGGRYDATNVLQPGAAVVLTNIALEHTDLLGETEGEIAAEKLAVCPDGADRLVVGPLSARARPAVDAECARRGLRSVRYGDELRASDGDVGVDVVTPRAVYAGLPLGLLGRFQRDNLAVALAGAEMLRDGPLDAGPLRAAIAAVEMPGRLEMFPGTPCVVLDGAHNPAGMEAMVAALPDVAGARRPVVAVISVLGDKDAAAMVGALATVADEIVATRSSHARAVEAEDLAALARSRGRPARAVVDPAGALEQARSAAGPGGLVVVAGSLYLLADLRARIVVGGEGGAGRLARARKGIDVPEAK